MAPTALGRSCKLVGIDDGGPGTSTLTAFPAGCACPEVWLRESGVCVRMHTERRTQRSFICPLQGLAVLSLS